MIDLIKKHEIYKTMKNIILILIFLIVQLELCAQEVRLSPKFFTLRNARISTALGFESGLNRFNGLPVELNDVIDSNKFFNYSLSVDLYAPNSFLGFMVEANVGDWNLHLRDKQNEESFLVRTIEFPFYLKLRFGRIEKTSRLWLVAGASYIMPLAVHRNYNYDPVDRDLSQVNGVKVLTGMFGYEQYFGERNDNKAKNPKGTYDRMRFVLFLRYSYILDNRLRYRYYQSSSTNSILKDYNNFNFKDMSVSAGIKYFIRF